jgi:hypothetical protein
MNTEDKIQRFAVDPNKKASYKARKFLRILTKEPVYVGITYKELNQRVHTFSEEEIEKARERFKGLKRASKYLRAMVKAINPAEPNIDILTRRNAEGILKQYKEQEPDAYAKAKKKLRGMTYED